MLLSLIFLNSCSINNKGLFVTDLGDHGYKAYGVNLSTASHDSGIYIGKVQTNYNKTSENEKAKIESIESRKTGFGLRLHRQNIGFFSGHQYRKIHTQYQPSIYINNQQPMAIESSDYGLGLNLSTFNFNFQLGIKNQLKIAIPIESDGTFEFEKKDK